MKFSKEGITLRSGRFVSMKEIDQRRKDEDMAKQTGIVKYDEELARQAQEYAEQEANTGGGQYFSTKGGVLKYNDAPMPDNQVGAIVLDSLLVNALYEGKFDPNNPSSPICYAFGRDDKTITPHDESVKKQCESCAECDNNKFGSGEGRGKACKNGRRLALLPAGTFDGRKFTPFKDPTQFEKGQIGFLNVPPTSINAFGAFVKQVAGTLRRPPHGIFTRVKLEPGTEGGGFSITFEPLASIPDSLLPIVMRRHEEARATIAQPFPKADAAPPAKKGGKKARRY